MAGSIRERSDGDDVPDPIARTYSRASRSFQPEPTEEEEELAAAQLREAGIRRNSIESLAGQPKDDDQDDAEKRVELNRLRSYATGTSAVSATTVNTAQNLESKPWYKQPNPMRWGKIPPVPTERDVCPEYKASFLSQLFFGWMQPLMQVGSVRRAVSQGTPLLSADNQH